MTFSRLTPDEFMRLPAKRIELVAGFVLEKSHVSLNDAALITRLGMTIFEFIKRNEMGQVALGGSFLTSDNNVRIPAFSFLSNEDLNGENTDELIRKAPTLAVEVVSFNDADDAFDDKADEFLRAGSKAVWIVNPRRQTVAVHTPDDIPMTYRVGDSIPGGEILPDLELPVAGIFKDDLKD